MKRCIRDPTPKAIKTHLYAEGFDGLSEKESQNTLRATKSAKISLSKPMAPSIKSLFHEVIEQTIPLKSDSIVENRNNTYTWQLYKKRYRKCF